MRLFVFQGGVMSGMLLQQRSLYPMWLALVLGLAGCSGRDPNQKVCYPVEGQVTVKGQPAAGALVVLQPAGGSSEGWSAGFPRATVESDGTFHVETYGSRDGAPAGEYVVLLSWPDETAEEDADVRPNKLDSKYNDPSASPLKATVGNSHTKLPVFNIP
jgi:hypothetical protein